MSDYIVEIVESGTEIEVTSGAVIEVVTINGSVSSVTSANADISIVPNTTTPVLTLNAANTGANKILRLDADGKAPTSIIDGLDAQLADNVTNAKSPPFPMVGIVGDGIADDTIALQNIINYCITNNSALNLGQVKCRITSTVYVRDSIRIIGNKGYNNNKGAYIILNSTDPNAIAIEISKADNDYIYMVAFENIMIGNANINPLTFNTTQTGLRINKLSEGYFDNISIVGFKIGLECREVSITDFVKLYIGYCKYSLWLGTINLQGVTAGINGMNNFYFCNFWQCDINVVLGGELQHFVGCHFEVANIAFLIDNAYTSQVSSITIRDCNIRHYTDNTRFIKINPSMGADALYVTQMQIENTFVSLQNATYAIEQLTNGVGNRSTRINISNCTIYGVTSSAVGSAYPMSMFYNSQLKVKQNSDGSGLDVPISSGNVIPLGIIHENFKNTLNGTLKLGNNTVGITNVESDFWYDATNHVVKYHNGTTSKALKTEVSSALIKITGDKAITNNTNTTFLWDGVTYDDSTFFNITNPTRVTVPIGVTRVKISCEVMWDVNAVGIRSLDITKNGGNAFDGRSYDIQIAPTSGNTYSKINTAIVSVIAGDYFEIRVTQTSGGNLNVKADARTWVSIESIK